MNRTSTHHLLPATPRTPRTSSTQNTSATSVSPAAKPNTAPHEGEPRPVLTGVPNFAPGQGAHSLSNPRLDLNGLESASDEQEAVADEMRRAKDAQTQSKIELRQQKAALKLDVRIASFMKMMQDFVDKLEKKYKLRPGALGALKNLFAQAQHQCLQRVDQGSQRVEAASATLAQHTREVQRLSALASGQQQNAERLTTVVTPRPATPEQSAELDDLINQLDAPEQLFVRKAAEAAQEVIHGNAPTRIQGRTADKRELQARWHDQAQLDDEATATDSPLARLKEPLFEIPDDDHLWTIEQMEKALEERKLGVDSLNTREQVAKQAMKEQDNDTRDEFPEILPPLAYPEGTNEIDAILDAPPRMRPPVNIPSENLLPPNGGTSKDPLELPPLT